MPAEFASLTPVIDPRVDPESLSPDPSVHELLAPDQASVAERNAWLDQMLDDPARPLPAVRFMPIDPPPGAEQFTGSKPYESTAFHVYSSEGKEVGALVMGRPINPAFYGGSDKHFIRHIQIYDGERGHGYGPATYLSVLKSLPTGVGLRTEGVLSNDGKRVWEGMVAKGVARPSDKGGTPTAFETVF